MTLAEIGGLGGGLSLPNLNLAPPKYFSKKRTFYIFLEKDRFFEVKMNEIGQQPP